MQEKPAYSKRKDSIVTTGICYIIGAGNCTRLPQNIKKEDMVIAVDGGYKYVKDTRVDLVVGDFDSLGYVPEHPNVLKLQPEKDDTDMLVALKEGLKVGYKTFHIYGGCGGRLDHTLANIQSLAFLQKQGAKGILHDDDTLITMVKNGSLILPAKQAGYLSVFSYSEKSEGVTLKGVKYPLEQATLTNAFPLGISNEFIGQSAEIFVEKGCLLILYSHGK